jgi:hypothetical protein
MLRKGLVLMSSGMMASACGAETPALKPAVELENDVYSFESADNGAGPMWCSGSPCLVRIGDQVFASGIETIKDAKPLNNVRWMLFELKGDKWELQQTDPKDRQREPCPLVGFPDGRLLLSTNPSHAPLDAYSGPAEPQVLKFSAADAKAPYETLLPVWADSPKFSEHSYRSFVADGPGGSVILMQNDGYDRANYALLDKDGKWSTQGALVFPWGAEYDEPEPVRVCYPDVALRGKACHFVGVSDIVEPYKVWRAAKKEITGRDWDYDFRRLFYTWTDDITKGGWHEWIELASRDKTCGWMMPGDMWVAEDGTVYITWTERAIDERLREKFFPGETQRHQLNFVVLKDGKELARRTVMEVVEGTPGPQASAPRFQVTPDGRVFLFCCVTLPGEGQDRAQENRVYEIGKDGSCGEGVKVPLSVPFTSYFTATTRGGSPLSNTIELFGHQAGKRGTMSYARIRLE